MPLLIILAEPLFASLYQPWEGNPEALPLLLCRLLFCVIVLLGPTTCMGATLPVLSKFLATRMSKVGMNIGGLYTVNTLGAFFGAALTGFFAISTLGLWGTTALAVVIDVVIGAVVIYAASGLDSTTPAPPAEKIREDGGAIEKKPSLSMSVSASSASASPASPTCCCRFPGPRRSFRPSATAPTPSASS